eukprot:scaffold2857_cov399-Prasinococcus_capsulatus_cf.AAC.4
MGATPTQQPRRDVAEAVAAAAQEEVGAVTRHLDSTRAQRGSPTAAAPPPQSSSSSVSALRCAARDRSAPPRFASARRRVPGSDPRVGRAGAPGVSFARWSPLSSRKAQKGPLGRPIRAPKAPPGAPFGGSPR